MRHIVIALALCLPMQAFGASTSPEGRWEGSIRIPDRTLPLVVDLAPGTDGAWSGSFIVPGLGIKGAPLANVVVRNAEVTFDTGSLLANPTDGPARFKAHVATAGVLSGEMKQGGNSADFALRRTGAAQVELPARSTAVAADVENEWRGDYEQGGYPRHVTITLKNQPNGAATARFVIVGKQTTDLPVDLVVAEGDFVRVESQANQVVFEGRYSSERGEINGIIEVGPFELPLVLHRSGRSAS